MASFKDKVIEMGYEFVERNEETLSIKKVEKLATIYILFNFTGKDIIGSICTNKPIFTLDEIAHHYKLFRDMQADLKVFKQLTGYDILN